jgi:adenosylmethionine-8-amino-7-oxononanoate aminotransferase
MDGGDATRGGVLSRAHEAFGAAMTHLFPRGTDLESVERAQGCWITDTRGKSYLDAASGALVVNIGHGDSRVTAAIQRQMAAVSYVHPSAFTSDVAERYAAALSSLLPMPDASIFPVSGGSEAVETALKAARAFHLAMGEPDRSIVIGRDLSYHGNTRGALDVSGREALRQPYLPWLDHAGRVPGVLEYRCPNPAHPDRCSEWHADRLDEAIVRLGAGRVAAFIAEPIGGAASGAAAPPDGYWDAVRRVCDEHGVLIIADEVMTGFGRTGRWFAAEHYGLEPDIMTLAKGAASGYFPLGVCAMAGHVAAPLIDKGFTHGLTFSHHPVGAAAGLAVLHRLDELRLPDAAAGKGDRLKQSLLQVIGAHPFVGEIRGVGLLLAVELVSDRRAKTPFPRSRRMAERLTLLARERGLLVYPSSGCAGAGAGDLVMIGPPLTITDSEIEEVAKRLAEAMMELK